MQIAVHFGQYVQMGNAFQWIGSKGCQDLHVKAARIEADNKACFLPQGKHCPKLFLGKGAVALAVPAHAHAYPHARRVLPAAHLGSRIARLHVKDHDRPRIDRPLCCWPLHCRQCRRRILFCTRSGTFGQGWLRISFLLVRQIKARASQHGGCQKAHEPSLRGPFAVLCPCGLSFARGFGTFPSLRAMGSVSPLHINFHVSGHVFASSIRRNTSCRLPFQIILHWLIFHRSLVHKSLLHSFFRRPFLGLNRAFLLQNPCMSRYDVLGSGTFIGRSPGSRLFSGKGIFIACFPGYTLIPVGEDGAHKKERALLVQGTVAGTALRGLYAGWAACFARALFKSLFYREEQFVKARVG